jgi:serine phosphatase RsbU (regulator of sigma subunit)
MLRKRKIKLAVLFISLLTVILVLLSMALSSVSLNYVTELGNVAVATDIKNNENISTTLFKKIAYLSSKEYSNRFNEFNDVVVILAKQVKEEFSNSTNPKESDLNNHIKLERYKNKNLFVNTKDNINAIYWGKGTQGVPNSISQKMNSISGLIATHSNLFIKSLNITSIWVFAAENFAVIYPHRFFYNKQDTLNSIEKDYENYKKFYLKQKDIIGFQKTTTAFWIPPYIDIFSGNITISVYSPVLNSLGKPVAFVGIDLNFKKTVKNLLASNILTNEHSSPAAENIDDKYNGFIFVLNKNGHIIALPNKCYELFSLPKRTESRLHNLVLDSQNKLSDSNNPKVKKLSQKILKLGFGTANLNLNNQNYVISFSKIKFTDWSLCYVLNQNSFSRLASKTKVEITTSVKEMKERFASISLLFLILSIGLAVLVFNIFFLKPINRIRLGIKKMGYGDFDVNLEEGGTFEISELAMAFNYLGEELTNYMDSLKTEVKARQAVETEVSIASDLQKSILPKITNEFVNDNFSLFATLKPAKNISGDFYDFFYLTKNKIALLIADVSGKGIHAALFMSMSKALLKSYCFSEPDDPAKVLEKTNNYLCIDNEYKMFVTVFLAYYDIKTGELTYANAGHHGSLLVAGDGKNDNFGLLDNALLGFFPDLEFNTESRLLEKDDLIVMYTDGIIEAVSPANEEYGEKRLTDLIVTNRNLNIDEICSNVIDDVEIFEEGNRFDDITLIVLKRNR